MSSTHSRHIQFIFYITKASWVDSTETGPTDNLYRVNAHNHKLTRDTKLLY